jgi:hypothetical protein
MALFRALVPARLYDLIARSGCARRDHGWRWHMFEEKREAVMAIEAAVLPLMPVAEVRAA